MKIRSITLGTLAEPSAPAAVEVALRQLGVIAARFAEAGFEVQTVRVSLPPLARLASGPADLDAVVRGIEASIGGDHPAYVALGPLRWSEVDRPEALAEALPVALAAVERVFGSIETADADAVSFHAARAAAGVVRNLAESTEHGFGNLRFAALANCPPDIPFFPAAYHDAPQPAFGLALQAADHALRAFRAAVTLAEAERELTRLLEADLARLEAVALAVEAELGLRYAGADPTPAPFPDQSDSIGLAIEALGVATFGQPGTLTVAALLTRAVRATRARRCGFAGLMLPVLEDPVLAGRAAERCYSWQDLLLYSAVCGLGLDTVPLPGDIGEDELTAMILDTSTLAVTLHKPLTCRLFPVPGKAAGDLTSFDFPFFANGGVLPSSGGGSPDLVRRGLSQERP